jgi:predicted ATPase/DNA-binding winged helix-turn-helix (wHTH) protein
MSAQPDAAPLPPPSARLLVFGDCRLDLAAHRLTRGGVAVPLPPRYFAVLAHLAGSGGRLVSKDELLDAVWGHRSVSDSALKVAINAVRVALGDNPKLPRHVETVSRRGYRFVGAEAPVLAAIPVGPPTSVTPDAPATAERRVAGLGNLPAAQPGLIGRDEDLARLQAALRSHRLVTLHGPGGVGKTRLALAAAAQAAPADGVWLLRLDTLADEGPLLRTLAQTLGLGSGAETSLDALARALAGQRLRLVIDNAEHVQAAVAALVSALLAGCAEVQMLVTSQAPLRVAGEQCLPLGPLALPGGESGGVAGLGTGVGVGDDPHPEQVEAAALRLLLDRVHQQRPDLRCEGSARADAAAICLALDGLPLALELAAARVPLLGWAGVRHRLDDRLTLLTRGGADAVDRHRTLRTALAWTCDLLAPAEWHTLQRLSVFAGSFTVEAAIAVAGPDDPMATLDALDTLRERSLLAAAGTEPSPRWRLYHSVRSFAADGLNASGDAPEAAARLLTSMTALFEDAEARFLGTPTAGWLAGLRHDVENLREALRLAWADPGLHQAGVSLWAASTHFRLRDGWRTEVLQDHGVVDRLLRETPVGAALTPLQQADVDLARARMSTLGQLLPPADAPAAARRARPVFQAAGRWQGAYDALLCEVAALLRLQRPPAERTPLLAELRRMEPPDWGPLQRRMREWMEVMQLRDEGDFEAFERRCRSLMTSAAAYGNPLGGWVAAEGLAQLMCAQDRTAEAVELLGQVVAERRQAGLLRRDAHVFAQWASLRITLDAEADTRAALHEAAQLMHADGRLWWMADSLAWLPAWQGRWHDAALVQGWADELVRSRGDQRGRLFGTLRARWDTWMKDQPDAARWRALVEAPTSLDDNGALHLSFGAV